MKLIYPLEFLSQINFFILDFLSYYDIVNNPVNFKRTRNQPVRIFYELAS